ncbi:hypothetical protein A1O7_02884 [Cladophialophora yegresii CBS 114405]|uniref:Uncharacterized protein n=1 Tax=Cladophialophora yegresii CBS 114405 TaxID=1182544 RepID=W9WVZ2_9EURO|nr:uncharacterized protein A1O7_02884 [Cladophialophora yegresii CBS 114405]EXJ62449.1 hypothetical protein A1O7_02884 [Cladophialophora yegresii CBS 114405]
MARNNTAKVEKTDANLLRKMTPDVRFYDEDSEGNIRPRNAWVSVGVDLYNNHLDVAARVALALTELCCDDGQGKIFIFHLPPRWAKTRGERENFHAYKAWRSLPALFYLPHEWTEAEQAEWKLLKPEGRLHRLVSVYGWVDDAIPVLPFDVELQHVQLERPQLDGLSAAPVTVYLSPKPYVFRSRDMHALCERRFRRQSGRAWPQRCVWIGEESTWGAFGRWRVAGGRGILHALDALYRDGPSTGEECVTTYGILVGRLFAAATKENETLEGGER